MPDQEQVVGAGERYGLLQIAGIDLALPITSLKEVVPAPEAFAPLPAVARGLVGAIELRRHIVPVLDLRPHLGIEILGDKPEVIIIVTDGTHLFGLLADKLRSVIQVEQGELMPVQSKTATLFFSHAFRLEGNGIVSVLDVAAIQEISGMPAIEDPFLADVALDMASAASLTGDTRKHTLLKIGDYSIALDIDQVFTTLPEVPLQSSPLNSDLCLGVTSYSGHKVPVVDPLVLLGLGALQGGEIGAGVVVKINDGYVVLALTTLLDIVDIDLGEVMALPPLSFDRPDMFLGVAKPASGSEWLVLDGLGLVTDHDMVTYAAINTEDASSRDTSTELFSQMGLPNAGGSGHGVAAQLVYSIGFDVVSPLNQVTEILPVPQTMISTPVSSYLVGTMTHRGNALPVVHLATLVGRAYGPGEIHCLLLVESNGVQIAFAVEGLRTIEKLSWSDPEESAEYDDVATAIDRSPLVQVGEDTRFLPHVDLVALVELLQAG